MRPQILALCGFTAAASAQSGACCLPPGSCTLTGSDTACAYIGGVWLGPGTTCTNCGPVGACCLPDFGLIYCEQRSQASCAANLGVFRGPGTPCTSCDTVTCYANCDGSSTHPALSVQDCICFINRFTAGEAWANCDGSTAPPVLNIMDFSCFMTHIAHGC